MNITKKNYKKILKELDLSQYPSLDNFLKDIKAKLKSKTPLTVAEELMTYPRLLKFFDDYRKEENRYYVNKLKFEKFQNRPPLPFQIEGIKFLLLNDRCILADDTGVGKAAPLDSNLLTPSGWIKMRDVKVGDEIIGSNGKKTIVKGVFPQGIKKICKIVFSDKSSVEVCEDHLWAVKTGNQRKRKSYFRIKTTKDLYSDLKIGKEWSIPTLNAPVEFFKKNIVLDSYILGCLLGDGNISQSTINFTTADEEILIEIKNRLPQNYILKKQAKYCYKILANETIHTNKKNILTRELKQLNLMGLTSEKKFIPDLYKYNTTEIRLAVLQGLLDTDGYISKGGLIQFYSTSKQLRDDVCELVYSLGGVSRKNEYKSKYKNTKGIYIDCKKNYVATINLPQNIIPFLLPRKQIRLKKQKKYNPLRIIKKIEFIGEKECQCISVSAEDKLYVMDNYVVTHNTIQSILAALLLPDEYKILVITLKTLKYNFEEEIKPYSDSYKVIEKTWESGYKFTIVHYESLKKWKKNILDEKYDCIIIDEVHKCKSPKTQRTKNVVEIVKNVKRLWLLTGTPMSNRPIDYYNLLKIIKHPLASNWKFFVERYCAAVKNNFGAYDVSGASNLEELYTKTKSTILRRLKIDVLKDLPNKDRVPVYLHLESKKEYEKIIKDFRDKKISDFEETYNLELENYDVNVLTKFLLWRQYCALKKIEDGSLIELVSNHIEEGNKIVIFTNFTKVVDAILEKFIGISTFIDGRISNAKERFEIIKTFNENDDLKVLVCNLQAGSVGLNIQSANVAIINDMDWVPTTMLQAEDRLWRMGQKREVNVFYLIYKDTIEETVFNIINSKMKIISTAIEGKEALYFDETDTKKEEIVDERIKILEEIFSQMK